MPKPRKRKGESIESYRSRLIAHYIREGYPKKQAIAIAYSLTTGKSGKKRKKRRNKK